MNILGEREAVWVKATQWMKDERIISAVTLEVPYRLSREAV